SAISIWPDRMLSDEDLKYLAGINLRSINLERTGIMGEGLRHLKPHKKWIFVDLAGCKRLDPKYLGHFKSWTLSTITAVGYGVPSKRYGLRLAGLAVRN